jgi:hypothetical protein
MTFSQILTVASKFELLFKIDCEQQTIVLLLRLLRCCVSQSVASSIPLLLTMSRSSRPAYHTTPTAASSLSSPPPPTTASLDHSTPNSAHRWRSPGASVARWPPSSTATTTPPATTRNRTHRSTTHITHMQHTSLPSWGLVSDMRSAQCADEQDHARCTQGNRRALVAEQLEVWKQRLLQDVAQDAWQFAPKEPTAAYTSTAPPTW